ncbi:MAG: hypothetical protein WCE57_13240, partial [Salegentibacter sp.]
SNPNAYGHEIGDFSLDYTLLSLPVGIRYFFYTGKKSNFFLQGFANFNKVINEKSAYSLTGFRFAPKFDNPNWEPTINFELGAGLRFTDHFLIDINYLPKNEISTISKEDKTSFKNSLILGIGYTF